jgi:alpha-tubulin suppressor-like RCC1 family protein
LDTFACVEVVMPSRFAVRSVVVLCAALSLACQEPLEMGRAVQLVIAPQFGSGRVAAAAALTIDSVHVNVRRAGALVAQAGKAVSPADTTVSLSIRIMVQGSRDTVEVELLLLSGGTELFSGTSLVEVRAGVTGSPAEIPLEYVGADSVLVSLSITPADTAVTFGDSLQFDATGYGRQEQRIDTLFASWSMVPIGAATPVGATLSRGGLLHAASSASRVYVKATAGNGVSDSVLVSFIPTLGALAKYSGDSATVAGGTTFPVAVRVTAIGGQPVQGVPVAFDETTGNGYPYYSPVTTDMFGIARTEVYAFSPPVGTNSQPLQVRAQVTGLPPVIFSATAVSFLVPAVPLATGQAHTCQIRSGGALYCWGDNSSGQLGDGTRTGRLVPTRAAAALTLVAVTAGSDHTCGLTASGTAYCWGANTLGQLGDSTTVTRLTPVAVAGALQFTEITAGAGFTCGVATGGTGYCWGDGAAGQLGNGGTAMRTGPMAISGSLPFLTISAFGDNHACALYYGYPYCWGANADGELGDSTTTTRLVPTLVSGGLYLAQIASGWYHTCGLDTYGTAYCWGDNSVSQLGWGTPPQDGTVPGAVQGGHTFISLAAGGWHTCGLLSNGAAYCWGDNPDGVLGNGTTTRSLVPVAVSGGLSFMRLSVGDGYTCGLTAAGDLYCWGRNTVGQIGDGSMATRTTPVLIP